MVSTTILSDVPVLSAGVEIVSRYAVGPTNQFRVLPSSILVRILKHFHSVEPPFTNFQARVGVDIIAMNSHLLGFVHRRCRFQEDLWARERDHLESRLLWLQKQYDTLHAAYTSLSEATVMNLKPPNLWDHFFVEQETPPEEQKDYLTPSYDEDREGITS